LIASVDSIGTVVGNATGTVTISYSNGCGTSATDIVTVNGYPSTITGSQNVCSGSSTSLSGGISGGSWSS
jgi:hypothetical protein